MRKIYFDQMTGSVIMTINNNDSVETDRERHPILTNAGVVFAHGNVNLMHITPMLKREHMQEQRRGPKGDKGIRVHKVRKVHRENVAIKVSRVLEEIEVIKETPPILG
ncbi:hypothetical protein FLK61_33765 [Paenalkalicoccus suaedae]|uniref:Uncharacterized protein n=1 Tax=Paenalkalicoccus suaedae TaxID=2592382 RepID=A0A859F950_9BACI|nr:hypothetical protein [Paenalkalicoccus suaedae]QKS69593.1 hypothetical protein FLK61_33765 [Paenalkalicoccus suaedae]